MLNYALLMSSCFESTSEMPTIRPPKQKSNSRAHDLRPSGRAFQRPAPAACWAAEDDTGCRPALLWPADRGQALNVAEGR